MKLKLSSIIIIFFYNLIIAQKNDYSTVKVSENLIESSNSVILNQEINIEITSQKHINVKKYKAVRVYNELGLNNIDAREYYDKSNKVIAIEAKVYNAFGKEIKSIKRKDFKDQSVADGFSVFTDNRILFLEYTPTEYPFTIIYQSESESSNTAFIPSWYPIDDFYESIVKSTINITYPENLGFKYKEINFEGNGIVKTQDKNKILFSVENLSSIKKEEYSPSFQSIVPNVLFGLEKFNLEGVEGSAKNWQEFGIWMYNDLLSGTDELPIETQVKIKSLIGNETNTIEKAKIIYKYVQDKTRYVSIQLGIGGWKPMLAKDVDRLGYGDCKALSNYTRALLKIVDIPSYYTIINAGSDKKNMEQDFVSMQGNHAILALPVNDKFYFLECTSQTKAFGFEGDFTDDRFALIVSPEKGEIIKTNGYDEKLSSQYSKANYAIDENGNINCAISIISKGIQYDNKYHLEKESTEKIAEYYKTNLKTISNLKLEKTSFNNNKEQLEFTENLKFNAQNYGSLSGKLLLFSLNAFNQYSTIPQRYRTRTNPFEIQRGFYDEDEFEITIPENYIIDAKPENYIIKDKFGEYKTEIIILNSQKIIYKRSLLVNKGVYQKEDYENYRKFREQIAKADNSKLVLTKKQ
ncbi:DUF3857 domain-containing protein [Flavobacterium sp.]|uniref:DUF3857 domain-containing protein n=1 Tax=Flavobacterium sp. TaxID=239 RepID=UPI00374D065F